MSSRRTLILLGAIAVGVIAAFLLYNYVSGIEDRANNNAKRVDVFTATTDIARGVEGSQAAVGSSKIPQEFRPSTAITSLDQIKNKVALFDIAQNTVIVDGMFVDPAQTQISFRARLKNPDDVAITISVGQTQAVGGFLVPGDEVNMMIKVQPPPGATTACPGVVATDGSCFRYLYQAVHILAVGSNTLLTPGEQASSSASTTTDTGNSNLITFNVPSEAARNIALAQELGVYLTLVPEDYTPTPLTPADISVLPAEDPNQLTPYGPAGAQQ